MHARDPARPGARRASGARSAGLAGPHAAVLRLQGMAGNRAVAQLARQVAEPQAPAAAPGVGSDLRPDLHRGDRGREVEQLQLMLNHHLGFLGTLDLLEVDGAFGRLTAGAVRTVRRAHGARNPTSDVDAAFWALLAQPPARDPASQAGDSPEYDRMFEDGLLDVTLVSGFDEELWHVREQDEIRQALTSVRGFRRDDARGRELLATAGQPAGSSASPVELYVKEDVRIRDHTVDVLVRFVAASRDDRDPTTGRRSADADARSAALRTAALSGMDQSDAFLYSGHARYGAGPDLDRNWTVAVDWSRMPFRRPVGALDEYVETDEPRMIRDLRLGGTGRTGATRMRALIARGAVRVVGHSAGNIGVTPGASLYQNELGGVLIGEATRGQEQPIASSLTQDRYRMWVFNACNTHVYEPSLRPQGSERMNERNLDTIQTNDEGLVALGAESQLSMLDGLLAGESAASIGRRLDRGGDDLRKPISVLHGFDVRGSRP